MSPETEAFGPRPARVHDLGDGRAVVYLRGGGGRQTVPSYLAAILTYLQGFRSLEGHARHLVEEGNAPGVREALVHLESLRDEGLLLPGSEFLETVPGPGEGAATGPARIERMAWVTRDRAETLLESVRSFVRGLGAGERRPELVVVDDSRDPSSTAALRSGLRELAESTGLPVSYMGPEEKESLIQDLVAACQGRGVPEALVRFALGNPERLDWTVGAAGNAVMLASAGRPLLLSDDDVFCRVVEPTDRLPALRVSSADDPTEFLALGDDARAALDGDDPEERFVIREGPEDILDRHEALLGRCLAGPGGPGGGELDLREVNSDLATHLSRHGGTVRVTTPGVAGDSGMGHPVGLLRLEGHGREELTWSEEIYEEAVLSRQVVRMAEPATLVRGGFLPGAQLGLDLRVLLPPFFPALRNSDGMYAATLRAGVPGVLTAHLPWAPVHEPPEARRFSREDAFDFRHRFCNLLMLLMGEVSPDAPSTEEGLEALGTRLVDTASLSPEGFRERVELLWLQKAERYLITLEGLLQRYGFEPEYWARDLQAHLEDVRAFMAGGEPTLPVDLRAQEGEGESEALARVMRMVRRFGELLRAWPDLMEAARELQNGGRRWRVEP